MSVVEDERFNKCDLHIGRSLLIFLVVYTRLYHSMDTFLPYYPTLYTCERVKPEYFVPLTYGIKLECNVLVNRV